MAISFGYNLIYSSNPESLYDFLSFIFDIEKEEGSLPEAIKLDVFGMKIKILKMCDALVEARPLFELICSDNQDLLELKQNIEFFYYKKQSQSKKIEISDDRLNFFDPECRPWIVHVERDSQIQSLKTEHFCQDVRNC